jgi:hypothetical protein
MDFAEHTIVPGEYADEIGLVPGTDGQKAKSFTLPGIYEDRSQLHYGHTNHTIPPRYCGRRWWLGQLQYSRELPHQFVDVTQEANPE